VSARARRTARLLAFEETRVTARERELGAARRVLEHREAAVAQAIAASVLACGQWLDDATSTELLAQASAHRRTLEDRVVAARRAVTVAKEDVTRSEAALVVARMAHRRIEILIEGFEQADAQRARKADRRAADEHAARRTGGV
jgi:flagellar export protein FliJ